MSALRSRQLSEKMGNPALFCVRVADKFQAAVHRPGSRNPRFQFNSLVLIMQGDDPLAAGDEVIRQVEPHPLNTDVRAAASQHLIRYVELSRKIDWKPWVSILESMHTWSSSLNDGSIIPIRQAGWRLKNVSF
jgi:hypothetical protein